MTDAVIVATARSAIGRAYKGALRETRADDLLADVVGRLLERCPSLDPGEIDDLVVGCALPGSEQGFNIARVVAVLNGLDSVPGTTVNRFCASSLQAIRMATHAIRCDEADAVIAGGVEVVSRLEAGQPDPVSARNPRFQRAATRDRWDDPRSVGRLPDVYMDMIATAENVAMIAGITRAEMDEFALGSQTKAAAADERGFWAEDITPVTVADGSRVVADDSPRPGTSLDGLNGLAPVQPGGTVTAGNACAFSDGAAAVLLMSDKRAAELGITPLARVLGTAASALSPEIMGLGPVAATERLLDRYGLAVGDVDQFEINEAFAVQVLASQRALGIPDDRLNVNGGAIALGHPYGMTGARIATTLLHSLQEADQELGVETMCVAGGMGMAMLVQRLA